MKLFTQLDHLPSLKRPISFAIGNYDGVHLGHQKILTAMRQKAGKKGVCILLTFSNHPLEVLNTKKKILKLATAEYKLFLLERCNVDWVILLEFDKTLANKLYDQFLDEILKVLPFDYFFIGKGDAIGRKKEGTFEKIKLYAKTRNFEAIQIDKFSLNHQPISSNLIRSFIQHNDLQKASELLSRPFGVFLTKKNTQKQSNQTFKVQLPKDLCLPPDGEYEAIFQEEKISATLENNTLFFRTNKIRKNAPIYLIKKLV